MKKALNLLDDYSTYEVDSFGYQELLRNYQTALGVPLFLALNNLYHLNTGADSVILKGILN